MNLSLVYCICTIAVPLFLSARGNPIATTARSSFEEVSTVRQEIDLSGHSHLENTASCKEIEYALDDVIVGKNSEIYLIAEKVTVQPSEYHRKNDTIFVCLSPNQGTSGPSSVLNCTEKFDFPKGDYSILPNKSALVLGNLFLEGTFELKDGILYHCVDEYEEGEVIPEAESTKMKKVSIIISKTGGVISIISLLAHLFMFVYLPSLRNLPGYNLASLSVAFLLGYSFNLIGQIPEVLGLSCIISAVLQQNFFLAAFFCMNVLAFDVWRTLKLATEKLVVGSKNTRRRQFMWYSLYAWGFPLVITSAAVITDNVKGVPEDFRPGYGKDDICFIHSDKSKAIFFAIPAFALFLVNAVFFLHSAWIISSNTMKVTKDENKQTVKLNYVLYVRLGLMMGLTWLVSIIALVSNNLVIWIIFDVLNSLQGLFLFLLFTCTKKVFRQFAEKRNDIKLSTVKQTTLATNSSSTSGKTDRGAAKF